MKGKDVNQMPTKEELRIEANRQKAIRAEFDKPMAQYQRGLLTAEEFLDELVGSYARGCEQAKIAKEN